MTSLRHKWLVGVLLLAVPACGGGGSSSAPVVATIVATDPPDGAVDVAPESSIRFVLSDTSAVLAAGDVVVSDGGNVLPGTLRQVNGSNTWAWTPSIELPRGCEVQVGRKVNGDVQVLSTFTVRDSVVTHEFELAGEVPGFALSWPNGRRAVVAESGNVFEVTATGLRQRFVAIPIGARAYGDGSFVGEDLIGPARFCVRGNLNGASTRVPTPFDVAIGEINANGDVVAHVSPDVGAPPDWGLWRWMHDDPDFSFAGSVVSGVTQDTPSIQSDGTVSLAYPLVDRVRLSRFAVGDLAGEHHELLVEATGVHFDSADDGRGLLAYMTFEPGSATTSPTALANVARFKPGSGLQPFPAPVKSWLLYLFPAGFTPFQFIEGVHVGDFGSGCVLLAHGTIHSIIVPGSGALPSANTFYEVVRVEPDDRLGQMLMYLQTIGQQPMERSLAHISPARAELWSVSDFFVPEHTWWLRSRPDGVRFSVLYKDQERLFADGRWCFSFDDSGRAVMAITEGSVDQPSMRVIVVN